MGDERSGDPAVESGTAGNRTDRLTKTIRDQSLPNVKPRDSATLILIDRAESTPKVLLGRRPGRTSAEEITLFKSLGLAVEDLAAAEVAVNAALARGIGTHVPW